MIPAAEDFFESALSVRPLSDPILLDRYMTYVLFLNITKKLLAIFFIVIT